MEIIFQSPKTIHTTQPLILKPSSSTAQGLEKEQHTVYTFYYSDRNFSPGKGVKSPTPKIYIFISGEQRSITADSYLKKKKSHSEES